MKIIITLRKEVQNVTQARAFYNEVKNALVEPEATKIDAQTVTKIEDS